MRRAKRALRWRVMRALCVGFAGILLMTGGALAADLRAVISRETRKCADAWQRSDYPGIVAYLPPRVIQQSGGRAAVVQELKDQFAEARSYGVNSFEAKIGQPSRPKQVGRWLASIIPVTALAHGPHLDLTQQTHVLALSADQGRRWYVVPLYQKTDDDLAAWFPEFRGKITLPATPAPELHVVY